jgi:type II secretory ATPase GspE/PulE/Tfp pilus assembly ATPase PilB-like protein
MIHRKLPTDEIREQWQKEGGVTLRQEALLLAKSGRTTLEEALSATFTDSVPAQTAA